MKQRPFSARLRAKTLRICLGTLSVILASSVPALAELGGSLTSVYRDAEHTNGTMEVRNGHQYTIYEIKTSTGTMIREFVSPNGTVFGIAWEGGFVPEMKQLLGAYFEQYSAAAQAATPKYLGRRPLNIRLPTLVFQTGGHMGWYYGRAYLPPSVPQEANMEEIH